MRHMTVALHTPSHKEFVKLISLKRTFFEKSIVAHLIKKCCIQCQFVLFLTVPFCSVVKAVNFYDALSVYDGD
jgi:hypothetical protein